MNAEHMSFELDDAKRHFFKNCQYVTRAPACVFLEGDKFSEKAKVLPIPLYAYAGIEEGKFKDFEYEEYNSHNKTHFAGLNLVEKVMIDAPLRAMERRFERDRIKKMYGKKFRKHPLYRRIIPDSGDLTQRKLYYPLFFYEFLKRDEKYRDKVKNCFKLKIWSDIDSMSGLNDDAAIATSSAMLLCREFFYDDARFLKLNELRKDLFEEIAIDYTFMKIFGIASALHFVTSGAAVFASLLGCSREEEIISYASCISDRLEKIFDFFRTQNKNKIKEEDKVNQLKKYFSVYMPNSVFDKIYKAEPLFEWSFEKLTSKDKLVISVIQRHIGSLFDKSLNVLPSNPEIKTWKISWRTFVMLGEPKLIALCERFPERHLFNIPKNGIVAERQFKDIKGSFFSRIYNSQRMGWGSQGASFAKIKEIGAEGTLEINFTETEVQLSGQKPLSKDYPAILFENIILNEKVHWLWGFVFLGSWTCGDILERHPKVQFSNYMSKEMKNLKRYGFDIKHKRAHDEWWIDYESTKSKVKCNLLTARDDYENALVEANSGRTKVAIEKLESAISTSYYSNVKFVDAYNLLISCIFKLNFKNVSDSLLSKIENFLRWYEGRLSEALFSIEKIYIKRGIISESNISNELKKMKNELKETQRNYAAVKNKLPITESEKEFEELTGLIHDLREVIEEEIITGGMMADVVLEAAAFIAFKGNKHVKLIKKQGMDKLIEFKPDLPEKETEVEFMLLNVIRKGINFEEINTIGALNAYLYKKLLGEIGEFVSAGKPLKEKLGYKLDKIKDPNKGKKVSQKWSEFDFEN